jgi:N4-(beta-N-acetylglucosaminyl)-L-asparaginase
MPRELDRREIVRLGGAAIGLATVMPRRLFGRAPAVHTGVVKPVVVSSRNGHRSVDSDGATCVEKAFGLLTGGSDPLEALLAGVTIVERDPEDTSVGYGGLPNAEGVVQLDSCCMHGAKRRAGGVAALEGVRTPSLVAQAVADHTDHHLIVGRDAQRFARSMGFAIEDDLNTDKSRRLWLEWKRRSDPRHYLDPESRARAGHTAGLGMVADGLIEAEHYYGTINCNGVSPRGELAGVTTTSGLAWKIPGRVGDSPILGAGLYVDGEIGAAGSTGRGEANLFHLASFLVVEEMRRGAAPKDAGLAALRRVADNTVEKRLLNSRGLPAFGLSFYVLNGRGEHAGVSMYSSSYAICTENGPQTLPTEALFDGKPAD